MSRTAKNIEGRCKDYSDLRKLALDECLAVLETEPRNCLTHCIAGRAYTRTEPSCNDSEKTLSYKAAVHYERARIEKIFFLIGIARPV